MSIEFLRFLKPEEVRKAAAEFGTPIYVYSEEEIEKRCRDACSFPAEYGLTARYAMKANPNSTILRIMKKNGIHIDASSEYEVERAILAGFAPNEILLTSQEIPEKERLKKIVQRGTEYNACSLQQLEIYGSLFPDSSVSIRINPGLGSGSTKKTDVGGVQSSFGIWHELIQEVQRIKVKYNLKIRRIHTHIGSGSDPEVWKAVSHYTLEYAGIFHETTIVNLGGGFKVGRMLDEKSTDFQSIGEPVRKEFIKFAERTGRKLHLEIEPGTYMSAGCGAVISRVMDRVNTGSKGYKFIKLNTGMDINTRPSLYGARHPLVTVTEETEAKRENEKYIVVGHCCETGDVFTQKEGGEAEEREMERTEIGDFVVMEGCGAYCAGMSTKNYNSYPESAEVLLSKDRKFYLIRARQTLEQIMKNEKVPDYLK